MNRHTTCRTCMEAEWTNDVLHCRVVGSSVDPDAKDHVCAQLSIDGGDCYTRRVRPKLTPEERHKRLSEAGKKGGSAKKSRTKGEKSCAMVGLRKCDIAVFKSYQEYVGAKTFAETMHEIARSMLAEHPEFKPQNWTETRA